jgi:hypothetical protein
MPASFTSYSVQITSRSDHATTGGLSPDSHSGGSGSIPGQVMWNVWWVKWYWGRFSSSTSVSPTNSHSSNSSIFNNHPLTNAIWARSWKYRLIDLTRVPECRLLSLKMWLIWLCLCIRRVLQLNLLMLRCGNILLFTVFRCGKVYCWFHYH